MTEDSHQELLARIAALYYEQEMTQTEIADRLGLSRVKVYRLLKESRKASTEPAPKDGIDIRPIGYSANKRNFEVAADYAWKQRTIPRQLKLEDLFDATTRTLD